MVASWSGFRFRGLRDALNEALHAGFLPFHREGLGGGR